MVGERTGETYRLGDRVEVKLVEAAPVAGALRFELLSGGAPKRARARPGAPSRNAEGRRTTPRLKTKRQRTPPSKDREWNPLDR